MRIDIPKLLCLKSVYLYQESVYLYHQMFDMFYRPFLEGKVLNYWQFVEHLKGIEFICWTLKTFDNFCVKIASLKPAVSNLSTIIIKFLNKLKNCCYSEIQ